MRIPKFRTFSILAVAVLLIGCYAVRSLSEPLPYTKADADKAEKLMANAGERGIYGLLNRVAYDKDKGLFAALLIKSGDLNTRIDLSTPLHIAAEINHPDLVNYLISHGADVNAWGHEGATPLHAAASSGSTDCVRILLDNHADPNSRMDDGTTPLMAAASGKGNSEIVRMLIAAGADPNAKDLSKTSVLDRAVVGNTAVASALISSGADINAENESWETLLEEASEAGKTELVKLLISRGVQISVLTAVRMHDKQTVEKLLADGADINRTDRFGNTALNDAVMRGYKDMVVLLVNKGANVNGVKLDNGTPLYYAVACNQTQIAKFLISKGADAKRAIDCGATPLHWVRDKELAKLLIARGADVNAVVKDDGATPLDWAIRNKYSDVAKLLRQYGAKRGKVKPDLQKSQKQESYEQARRLTSESNAIYRKIWPLVENVTKSNKSKVITQLNAMLTKYAKHPAAIRILCALGKVYEADDPDKAASYYQQAMDIKVDGDPYPAGHMYAIELLAGVREKQGRYKEATELMENWKSDCWCGNGAAADNFDNIFHVLDLRLHYEAKERVIAGMWSRMLSSSNGMSLGIGPGECGWAYEIRRLYNDNVSLLISDIESANKKNWSRKPKSDGERYCIIDVDKVIKEIARQIEFEKNLRSKSTRDIIAILHSKDNYAIEQLDDLFSGGYYSRGLWQQELIIRTLYKRGTAAQAELIETAKSDISHGWVNPIITYCIAAIGGDNAFDYLKYAQSRQTKPRDLQVVYYCMALTNDTRARKILQSVVASKNYDKIPEAATYALKAYVPSTQILQQDFSPEEVQPRQDLELPYY